MSNLENKEKNLNTLIEKLSNLSNSYTQTTFEAKKIKKERDFLEKEKSEIENKHNNLLKEHKYLKNKLK